MSADLSREDPLKASTAPDAASLEGTQANAPDGGQGIVIALAPRQETRGMLATLHMLSPPLVALAVFVLVSGALAFLHAAASFLGPIILSLFMVTLALPASRSLRARGVGKGLVLLIMFTGMIVFGVGLALLAYLYVDRLAAGLGESGADLKAGLEAVINNYVASGAFPDAATALTHLMLGVVAVLSVVIAQFAVSAMLAAFLLLEASRLGRLLNTRMSNLPFLGLTPEVMNVTIRYFMIRLRLNAATGLVFGAFLWLIGIPYAGLWGLLTIILSFVPYVGLVVAATPAVILAFAQAGLPLALLVILAVVIINFVVENVAAPAVTGRGLSLSPAIVFISFFFWVWLLGPIGALVSMPITVLLMLTFARYESTRWVAEIIGNFETESQHGGAQGE